MHTVTPAYALGARAALHQLKCAFQNPMGLGATAPTPVPTPPPPAAAPMPRMGNTPNIAAPNPSGSEGAKTASADFFHTFLHQGDDNPTEALRKMAVEQAVESALEKLSEPASRMPGGRGTRFTALKHKLRKQKNKKSPTLRKRA